MAKITYFQDDFDGTTVDDTVRTRTVRLEEGTLNIDLSDENYGLMMDALTPFIDKGEWTERDAGADDENALIRKWARENGKDVSRRGRLSKDLVSEYREYLKSHEASTQPASEPNADNASDNEPDNVESDNVESDNGRGEPATSVNA